MHGTEAMSGESRTLTEVSREELYNLVWSEPLTKLARRFGLSATGLSKMGKRHKIPLRRLSHQGGANVGRRTRYTATA